MQRVRYDFLRWRYGSQAILLSTPPPAQFRIAYGSDPNQFADLRLPDRADHPPIAIVIHGGFWRARYDLTHIGHLCTALAANGIATWSIEYRRVGNFGGGYPGTFLDVAAAANHLRSISSQYNLDLSRVIVLGHSAGGHLALWYAGLGQVPDDSPIFSLDSLSVLAAFSLAGVNDLKRASELKLSSGITDELIGGSPGDFLERFQAASPIELLPLGVRQFLLHGIDDDIVPVEMSQRYVESARAKGDDATLITFPKTGHFELIDPASKVWTSLLQTIKSVL